MNKMTIKLGMEIDRPISVMADISKTGHICLVGGTGSGKTVATLYFIYNILCKPLMCSDLYIGDFKKSNDYKGISNHFAEFSDVVQLIEDFYIDFQSTPENNPEIKILLIDEYAGFIIWLLQQDKKKCEEVKGKISNILMLGRSRHCYVWCVQQRISSQLFTTGIGAIDNFQICIGLGRLSVESRKSLFAGEHLENAKFERNFRPKAGQGLCLIDGQTLKTIQIPWIEDKEILKVLLSKKANLLYDGTNERRRLASK